MSNGQSAHSFATGIHELLDTVHSSSGCRRAHPPLPPAVPGWATNGHRAPLGAPFVRPAAYGEERVADVRRTGLAGTQSLNEEDSAVTDESLSSHVHEMNFAPEPSFAEQANGTADLYDAAAADHEGFWADQARSRLTWSKDFERTLDWDDAPFAKWFVGGELNVSYNCVDRHVEAGNGDRVAIHFEGEGGDTRTITYADLQREVAKAANALVELGVGTGDTVAIYMPMIPETVVTMLACARLGAPHSVIFGGFSAEALHTRIDDAQCKLVVTTDGQFRRGKAAPLKAAVD